MTSPVVKPGDAPILLIDDDAGVMNFVLTTLERNGYSVVCASSGAEGVERLKTGQFMGVVSDMLMPGGVNGAGVYAWIAENRPELAGKIVFITGDTADEQTVATLQKTGAPYLQKPFLVQQFIAVVENIIGKPQ